MPSLTPNNPSNAIHLLNILNLHSERSKGTKERSEREGYYILSPSIFSLFFLSLFLSPLFFSPISLFLSLLVFSLLFLSLPFNRNPSRSSVFPVRHSSSVAFLSPKTLDALLCHLQSPSLASRTSTTSFASLDSISVASRSSFFHSRRLLVVTRHCQSRHVQSH